MMLSSAIHGPTGLSICSTPPASRAPHWGCSHLASEACCRLQTRATSNELRIGSRHQLSSASQVSSSVSRLDLEGNDPSLGNSIGKDKSFPDFRCEASTDKDTLPGVYPGQGHLGGFEVSISLGSNGAPPCSVVKDLESDAEKEAWDLLRSSIVSYAGCPIGTIAAQDPTSAEAQNYDQVFIRDFIPAAIAFLLRGESAIVREFLLNTLHLQSWDKSVDCYNPGQGLMPASFKVRTIPVYGSDEVEEVLDPDFGEAAIGRVAPVDSGLWWIILLRAYGKYTGDYALQEDSEVQIGIQMILQLCLADGFDMFPTLLVTDGSCMIDRRMGIHGHPLEIQALFFSALRCAQEMIIDEEGTSAISRSINSRLSALVFHVREYYWIDLKKLNEIYRYQTEEYSHEAVNKFNIYPDQIPTWLLDWIPDRGGYLMGNLQPAHMDFRFFTLGNLWSIVGSLTADQQSNAILDLIDARWKDFVGRMPLKIAFPALECEEWRIITGADPKNTPWSYHNAGSWPVLLWQFTVACIKMNRLELAQRAVEVAEEVLVKDRWPEYYDTRSGRLIGKQARLQQTWTIAGFLVTKMLLRNPEAASMLTCEDDMDLLSAGACGIFIPKRRGRRKPEV